MLDANAVAYCRGPGYGHVWEKNAAHKRKMKSRRNHYLNHMQAPHDFDARPTEVSSLAPDTALSQCGHRLTRSVFGSSNSIDFYSSTDPDYCLHLESGGVGYTSICTVPHGLTKPDAIITYSSHFYSLSDSNKPSTYGQGYQLRL